MQIDLAAAADQFQYNGENTLATQTYCFRSGDRRTVGVGWVLGITSLVRAPLDEKEMIRKRGEHHGLGQAPQMDKECLQLCFLSWLSIILRIDVRKLHKYKTCFIIPRMFLFHPLHSNGALLPFYCMILPLMYTLFKSLLIYIIWPRKPASSDNDTFTKTGICQTHFSRGSKSHCMFF